MNNFASFKYTHSFILFTKRGSENCKLVC